MLLGELSLVDGLLVIAALLGIFYYYMTSTFDYWKKKGVPYVKPSFLFGNLKDQFLVKTSISGVFRDIYNGLSGKRFGGYFESRTPVLMIRDPALVQQILVKDFSYFINRDFEANIKREPLSANLTTLKGDHWRNLRNKLTPTFTSGKLKGMIDQIYKSGDELVTEIDKSTKGIRTVDAKKLASVFTIDVISSCAFGLQFKPDSPEGVQFRKMIDELFAPSVIRVLQLALILYLRPLAKLLQITRVPSKVSNYFIELTKKNIEFREKNNIQRNDFLQLMMNLKAQEAEGKQINWKKDISEEDDYLNQMDYTVKDGKEVGVKVMTDQCIAAQSFVFLTAGSEVIASTFAFILYELAVNPQVQTKLQQEIDLVLQKNGGKLTYQSLQDMSYLDMVIQETNRKYSPAGFLRRECNTPYRIPDSDVVIEKGTKVVISILAIHNDPAIYPEPDKFIPERFEGNNHRTNGSKYIPFGDGPRICIAMRFVIVELRACVARVMSKYSVALDPRTEVPLRFNPKSVVASPCGGIWVKFHSRE